ncbi:hypothetical protein GOP47_0022568 [Adiantum capillus-veneris]|uniref:Membrin n=1 Tax=Adiantum capillus-veneris TaxID=13818 RepID=A0A9D4U5L2_ADICA|nr:hypothetical protein GOP47_0022568 [Adiantum capillus-veneris]
MAGATISEIYQKARHSLLVVRDGLERLERLESAAAALPSSSSSFASTAPFPSSQDAPGQDLAQNVKRELSQLQQYGADMDRLWRSQIAKPQRDLWKRKVEQIMEEADSLRLGLDKYFGRQNRRQAEAKERADLFQRTKGDGSEGARILQIYDEEMQAMQSAKSSSRMLDEAYATGAAVLVKYAEQRERLKHAQRKALDILNTVGLSNSVLKLVERRHRVDKWISYVGMVATVVIVVVVWLWLH